MASSQLPSSAFGSALECETDTLNAKLLKPLDEILRCQICCEYFRNCMMTKCNHNYCSFCIRSYMNYKSQCPTCFQVATEPELQNNRLIDEIVQTYIKVRESLHIPPESIDIPIPEQCRSYKSVTKESLLEIKKAGASNNNNKSSQQKKNIELEKVSCPVCDSTILKSRINVHLDICLKQSDDRSQQRMPKLVYHLMSDKEIKKKLKENGLSTSGDRQVLVRRHKNFITLFNSNCDSFNPRPVEDLLLEIERQELEERLNATPRIVQLSKRSSPTEIERKHKSYLQRHQSQFKALIQDVQERALAVRHIKQEVDNSEVTTSNITDESGNVIGESIFSVQNSPLLEAVTVKKEPPDSPLEDVNLRRSLSSSEESLSTLSTDSDPVVIKEEPPESLYEDPYVEDNQDLHLKSAIYDNEPDSGMEYMDTGSNQSSQLPFRVKKNLPVTKIKEEPQFLLDPISNQEYTADSPSSIDDFETSKNVKKNLNLLFVMETCKKSSKKQNPKKKLCNTEMDEKRKKCRERVRKYRAKMTEEKKAKIKAKNREYKQKMKDAGVIKNINQLSKREQQKKRRQWKKDSCNYRRKLNLKKAEVIVQNQQHARKKRISIGTS